jgi:hypothetical protein
VKLTKSRKKEDIEKAREVEGKKSNNKKRILRKTAGRDGGLSMSKPDSKTFKGRQTNKQKIIKKIEKHTHTQI